MKTVSKILKIKTHYQPFNIFDVDKENITLTIGNMKSNENVFTDSNAPNYIRILCELVPIKNFNPSLNVLSRYQKMVNVSESMTEFSKKIYSSVQMNGFVSSIDIIYKDILPDTEIPPDWRIYLSGNPKIYTKNFLVQQKSMQISMTEDHRFEQNMYYHLISGAYPYAGAYYKGIAVENIEQYFFYIGTELQAKEYMNTISSKKVLSGGPIKLCQGLKASEITSLQNDITSGKINLTMQDKTIYQSLDIKKDTIISNACVITFKKQ